MADTAVRAAAMSGADLLLRQGLQFVITAVLARILTPADFGAVALASVVIAILSAVADLGARTSIVRNPGLDEKTIASAYWLVLFTASALAALTAWAAPALEWLTGVAQSGAILQALAPVIVFNAVGGVSVGLLIRSLRFGTLALVGAVATIAGGALALALAERDAGPWPLIVMTIASSAVMAIGTTASCRPRLLIKPSPRHLKHFVEFGRFVVATMLLDAGATRVPLLVVGLRFGITDAGLYSRADTATQSFKEVTDSVLGRVALPLLARSGDDDPAFVAGVRTGFRFGMAVIGPLMLFAAAVGTPLTIALFGPQWVSAGPMFSALAVGAAVWPIHVVAINALLARGHARTVLSLDLRNKLALVTCAGLGAAVSPLAVALGVALAQIIAALFNMRALAGVATYPVSTQVRDVTPLVLVASPWALAAGYASTIWNAPPVVVTAVLLVACVVGTGVTAHLFGLPVLREVLGRLRSP